MSTPSTYTIVPISSIIVNRNDRQRKTPNLNDTGELEKSIRKHGLIQPIVVKQDPDQPPVLIAGERRLLACKKIGHTEIAVRFYQDLDPVEAKIIELEENIKRKNLTWQEQLFAIVSIHQLFVSQNTQWTQAETATNISISRNVISRNIKVHKFMGNPRISEADSLDAAQNIINRWEARREGNAFGELLDKSDTPINFDTQPQQQAAGQHFAPISVSDSPVVALATATKSIADDILHQSFLEWAPAYTGPKFNFIHLDFPWGLGNTDKPQRLGAEPTPYEDTYEGYIALLKCFAENFWNFGSLSSHIMFWYSIKTLPETLEILSKVPIQWSTHPLIWVHSDGTGISPNPRRDPRHVYDTCLLGSLGDREIVKVATDTYSCPTDHKFHPSTKPEPMLRHFFSMFVDQYTYCFDPTCGSGSALRAAESLGASRVLGLEAKWEYCEAARKALKDSRVLSTLSGSYI